jgi:ribosomal protein S18 acetylase RimI-like enzyme
VLGVKFSEVMSIELATDKDIEGIYDLLLKCRDRLIEQEIHQWDEEYPSIEYINLDVSTGSLRKLTQGRQIVGVVSFDDSQEPQYAEVPWKLTERPIVVIHRLAVLPEYQGNGFAGELMNYAERSAFELQFSSIRLDAYSGNSQVVQFYERRGYKRAGEVYFPRRELPFICMERTTKI